LFIKQNTNKQKNGNVPTLAHTSRFNRGT